MPTGCALRSRWAAKPERRSPARIALATHGPNLAGQDFRNDTASAGKCGLPLPGQSQQDQRRPSPAQKKRLARKDRSTVTIAPDSNSIFGLVAAYGFPRCRVLSAPTQYVAPRFNSPHIAISNSAHHRRTAVWRMALVHARASSRLSTAHDGERRPNPRNPTAPELPDRHHICAPVERNKEPVAA